MSENHIVVCPHCFQQVIIEKKNCGIFRHGINKSNFKQIDPHLNKKKCDQLLKENKIYGCGKPFKLENNKAIICDYI